ncbi:MAG: glycosyltransferase family 39 protein [Alphaproteobacteria bacterium]|nr:glycosyltransferase family 39 protein [Alphaproteobacteria bacterium]
METSSIDHTASHSFVGPTTSRSQAATLLEAPPINRIPSSSRSRRIIELGATLILIALGLMLRLSIRLPTDLWQDEIIAATHAMQPLRDVVIDVLRNDTHPPLYFLQLHFWALLGQSDTWLMANSIAWSFAGLFSLWWITKQHYGSRVALIATALYAVLPAPVYLSDQVRMYPMLATFTIWAFNFATLIFKEDRAAKASMAALTALLIATVFTHAIGSIAVAANGLYALHATIERRRRLRTWLWVYGISAIAALPWLTNSILHEGNLREAAGIYGVALNLALTVVGITASFATVSCAIGVVCFAVIMGAGLTQRQATDLTWYFLGFPVLLSILVGLAFRPVFKWNFFSTLEGPFIALVLAMSFLDRRRWHTFLAIGCTLALASVSVWERYNFRETSGYSYLAKVFRNNYRPGDIIYVPQEANFWGIAWYLVGPGWGSPLRIAAPPSAQWRKVYDKLGPGMVAQLGLMPETQILDRNGFKLLTGPGSADQARGARRIWVVTLPGGDPMTGQPPLFLDDLPQQWHRHQNTWVTLYAAEKQLVALPSK